MAAHIELIGDANENAFGNTHVNCRGLAKTITDTPINTKNGAEAKNWKSGKPVRVVRNCKLAKHSKYAPVEGNRYDGIYKVLYFSFCALSDHCFFNNTHQRNCYFF